MKSLSDVYRLNDGHVIPCVGFGTYLSRDGEECYDAVREALKIGYRHVDTAAFYANEQSVGAAIRDSGIKRSDVFVTTKVWNDDQGYDNTMRAFEKSYKNLGLDYIDLYLIHWPIPKDREHDYRELNKGTWKAFSELKEQKLIISMGVSNFLPEHIDFLVESSGITPAVNQIELHPALKQDETVEYCFSRGIVVEAWRPILKGEADKCPQLAFVAKKHNVTASQVCLRWELQRGILPLPKSVHADRIRENADIFSFELDEEDLKLIASVPEHRYGAHPLSFGKKR